MTREGAKTVVIIGAGHAGAIAAAQLRQVGFEGEVILLGAESTAPYERPPLSKSLLGGDLYQPILPPEFYVEQELDLRLGVVAVAIDVEGGTVQLDKGARLGYDALILATGASARELDLPGSGLEGVCTLRTLDDARHIEATLRQSQRLTIVGGGWIGLEVASSMTLARLEVTVLEREPRLLARVASPEFAEILSAAHSERGVEIVCDARVAAFAADSKGGLDAVVMEDGTAIESDAVLVAAGASANVGLALEAGLACDEAGITVDGSAKTSAPAIYAIGDVTARPLATHGGLFRFESIPSAVEQARQAVASITGTEAPSAEVPWFWSDQFEFKVRIAGTRREATTVVSRTGASATRGAGVAFFHLRGGRLLGVETLDAAPEFILGRRLIRDAVAVDPEWLSDPSAPIEESALHRPAPLPGTGRGNDEDAGAEVREVAKVHKPIGKTDFDDVCSVTYVQPDGTRIEVSVAQGANLMEAAVRANIPGIVAECGGTCSCATCHVYVNDPWLARLQPPGELERDLIDYLDDHQADSRLACQIPMRRELDGIVVRVTPGLL